MSRNRKHLNSNQIGPDGRPLRHRGMGGQSLQERDRRVADDFADANEKATHPLRDAKFGDQGPIVDDELLTAMMRNL